MRIKFCGADQTVTGSQHLIEANGARLLLDCGLYQGKRAETYRRNQNFPFDPATLNAVVLSHAHIDHSGNLPNLGSRGFDGPIYSTQATADLARVMLLDSAHIQEYDAAYVNKKRARRSEQPIEPLYTSADAEKVNRQFRGIPYNNPFSPAPGITVTFYDGGHILGSAGMRLDIEEKGNLTRFWYSGDIGRQDLPLLHDPVQPAQIDYLLMEATYGDIRHSTPAEAYAKFREVVIRTVQRRGKIIVPAFAVGRTQELVYMLNQMVANKEIPVIPIFVDSPLAVNATSVFTKHSYLFDDETRRFVEEHRHPALDFPGLVYTQSVDDSKAINNLKGPLVIISASGMAETGRILHHLRNNIEDPNNTIMIVSWQAPDTLGRRLADKESQVKIFGEWFRRRAEVAIVNGLSAHAGQDALIRYGLASRDMLKRLMIVHSEPIPANVFKGELEGNGFKEIIYPAYGDEITLGEN